MLFFLRNNILNNAQPLLRVGILGLGRISDIHIRAFTKNKYIRIDRLADIRKDLVIQTARQLGVDKYSTDYRTVLRDSSIDVVDILLPHYLHAKITQEALKAGKHVICEKPLSIRPRDIDSIAMLSVKAKKNVYLKQYFRFSRLHQMLAEAIERGEIGKPYLLSCAYTTDDTALYNSKSSWRGNKREAGGGVFMDVGVHMIDFLQSLFGSPRSVMAIMKKNFNTLPTKGEDTSIVTLEFDRGVVGNIICTAGDTSYGFRWEKHFYGSLGSMHLVDNGKSRMELWLQKNNKSERIGVDTNWWDRTNIAALDDITERIIRQDAPAVSLQIAKNTMNAIHGAYTSANTGKKIII